MLSVSNAQHVGADIPAHLALWLAIAASLALPLRRSMPRRVVALAVLAAVVGVVLPLLIMLFHLAARNRSNLGALCAAVAMIGNAYLDPDQSLWTARPYGPALLVALSFALGLWAGGRRRLIAALAAQIEHLRTERELRARQEKLTERARIAAEMHDVLAHHLSLIALHTGVLAARADLPEPVAERLTILRSASTAALNDLREVLSALRCPNQAPNTVAPPALRGISTLVDEARAAGQIINTQIEGDSQAVPAAHHLAVLRLVQEGLTNARKHAPHEPVQVDVTYKPTTVEINNKLPQDSCQPTTAPGGGHGLNGLAERVTALGGRFAAGPADGRWFLHAHIPCSQQRGKDVPA
ncbi:sensor histidine kinase [Kitasatospora sp. GAS204B]|uniref:sensor histidine kinase n=1 Tax=unclassified Kitasatospora TaxID=2633591 RepID=UPI002476CCA1|nr:histidine kinase [Kitasatospora sp. GAS204B]MDH6119798.1 signal transduction histidine kinase [Kitasatospora sp. GAS204B]